MDHAENHPAPGPTSALALLRGNADFRRLFVALLVSYGGDWFLFVALTGLLFSLTHSPGLVAALLAAMTLPLTVFSFVGGPLADRANRQMLMVAADLVRCVLALGFFLVQERSDVWLLFVLASSISALGAIFEPASTASVRNLVAPAQLAIASSLVGASWSTMLAVGAAVGGLVVGELGRGAGYVGDALSFLVSATLVLRIQGSFSAGTAKRTLRPNFLLDTLETLRYARADRRVLALLTVKGGYALGAGVIGLLPLLSLQVLHAGDRGTGLLLGFRGIGSAVGPFLGRRFVREDRMAAAFWGITTSFAAFGLFYAAAAWSPGIVLVGLCVLVAHLGAGAQWMLSTYALQILVPDGIRGRIFAFDFGFVALTLAVSSVIGGRAAESFDIRLVISVLALIELAFATVWTLATSRIRHSYSSPDEPASASP